MTGIAQVGAQKSLNVLVDAAIPVVSTSAPSWIPGLIWINNNFSPPTVNQWNGSSWVIASAGPRLALLTADPTGQSTISGLSECADSGYSRVQVIFNAATSAYPSVVSNSSLLSFGPFTVNMSLPVQWLALVSSTSGTSGFLLNTWTLSAPQQVSATQSINIAAGALAITQQ